MAKRAKRLEKGVESLKKEIEKHFDKIEEDILEKNIGRGMYHIKEIDKSLLASLEIKLKILGIKDDASVLAYRKRLEEMKKLVILEE